MSMETLTRVSKKEARTYAGTDEILSEAIGVRCPDCCSGPNEPCRNSFTGQATRIPHPRRHRAATAEPPELGS